MMNTLIVRQLFAAFLKVKPTEIKLETIHQHSRIFNGDYYPWDCIYSGGSICYGWNPEKGFFHLPFGQIMSEGKLSEKAAEMLPLFILKKTNTNAGEDSIRNVCTLYKIDGCKERLKEIEENDIARWEQWLNE